MDDIRLWLFSVRLGWRWCEGQLCFCRDWRIEEKKMGMTGLEKTIQVLKDMMNSITSFLKLTMESEIDFGGTLPSLDLTLWVRDVDNKTLYAFYEKPMVTNMMIQRRSAMPENMLMSTLNMEMYRRMTNTSEMVNMEKRLDIVDRYGQKLTNSGFGLGQARKAIVGGLVRYERRLAQCLDRSSERWRPLHEDAKYNACGRRLKKLVAKTAWFKKRKIEVDEGGVDVVEEMSGSAKKRSRRDDKGGEGAETSSSIHENSGPRWDDTGPHKYTEGRSTQDVNSKEHASNIEVAGKPLNNRKRKLKTKPDPPTIAVMFVDQTVGGVLAKMLQEVEDRLADITGYRVRITEMSGSKLCRILSNTNPWGNRDCERKDCYTCSQSGERLENCKGRNLLYETMCELCNKEVLDGQQKQGSKWKEFKTMIGVYVGETARRLYERI